LWQQEGDNSPKSLKIFLTGNFTSASQMVRKVAASNLECINVSKFIAMLYDRIGFSSLGWNKILINLSTENKPP